MSYSTNPVADADRFFDVLDTLNDSAARASEQFTEDTRKAFAEAYKGGMTMVEWVQRFPGAIRSQPTREAFYEELDYLIPQQALWKVLQESNCPLVAQLKKAVEDSYIERWAGEIGEFRGEA